MSCTQIIHGHDFDHQARPPSKVLRPLTLARLRVVLLPSKARFLPALVHRVYDVLPQSSVQVLGLLFVGTILRCNVL